MKCLDCVRGRERDTSLCQHCSECHHLCQGKCPNIVRIAKQKEMDRKRSIVYWVKEDAVKDVVEKTTKMPDLRTCENCPTNFKPAHALQRFCSQRCGRHVRNKNYRLSRYTPRSLGISQRPTHGIPGSEQTGSQSESARI